MYIKLKSNLLYMLVAVIVIFAIASATTGCQPTDQPTSQPTSQPTPSVNKYGGILKVADQQDATPSLGYPGLMTQIYQYKACLPAIESLFYFDTAGKVVPGLATELKENAAAKYIEIPLRKGIKFHDGSDFNAVAVKWNLDQWKLEKLGGTASFQSIDVVDDYTVRIILSAWDSTVKSNLAQYVGLMISPTAFKTNGKEWCMSNPVGTGPFQFVSWVKDTKVTYKKFDGYWQKGKPYLDGVEYVIIKDPSVAIMSLQAGEIDIVATIETKDVDTLKKAGFIVKQGGKGGGSMIYIGDSARPTSPFANLKVRQAVAYATDRDGIVNGIFNGLYETVNQYVYKGHWAYNPSVAGYPYNLDKAKQLMSEAGYPNGFKTKLSYLSSYPYPDIYAAIQGMLTKIGIDATLQPLPSAKYSLVVQGGEGWEGLVMGLGSPTPDTLANLSQRYVGGGKNLVSMITPDDYLQAIKNAISAPDFSTQQKWMWEVQKLMIDKYCLGTVILQASYFTACKPNVKDDGWLDTPYRSLWAPADCWLQKK